MKSDQVASRNWRRGQCQSRSLSRSRSWQRSWQRSRCGSVICALALAFNLFALCATATIPSCPAVPSLSGRALLPHMPRVLSSAGDLALLWASTEHRPCTVIAGHICITIVSFHPDPHSPFPVLHSTAFHCILHSTAFPTLPFSHSTAFRALWRLPPIRIRIRHLMLTAKVGSKLATAALFSIENYCNYY